MPIDARIAGEVDAQIEITRLAFSLLRYGCLELSRGASGCAHASEGIEPNEKQVHVPRLSAFVSPFVWVVDGELPLGDWYTLIHMFFKGNFTIAEDFGLGEPTRN